MYKLAKVDSVSWMNLHKNIKNTGGLLIFMNSQAISQTGSRIVKNSTGNKEYKKK